MFSLPKATALSSRENGPAECAKRLNTLNVGLCQLCFLSFDVSLILGGLFGPFKGFKEHLKQCKGMFNYFYPKYLRQIDRMLSEKQVNTHSKNLPEAPPQKLEIANKPVRIWRL